jgi:hypothetical protein
MVAHMPVVSALRRPRHEDPEFKASLGYKGRDPVSKHKKKQQKANIRASPNGSSGRTLA